MLLTAENITKSYGTRILLDHVSLYLNPGDKIGVIGANGMGKSTLLKILAGVEESDEGNILRDPNVRLEYLPQDPAFSGERTVLKQVFAGLSPEACELAEYEAKAILTRMGITDFEQPVGELSGGQRKRVALASALVHPCDVLILDEPTNHLDSEMVRWLEDYLRQYKGALVMVTHDRYFLQRVITRIVEADSGKLYFYEGNYEDFLRGKTEREEMAVASERKRQSVLRREYQWVMQGPTARGTKSRERLERYEALKSQRTPEQGETLALSALSSRLGKKTIELKGVSKSFGDKVLLQNFDCILLRDDRIGIVGVNGSGKSTLLNLFARRLAPDKGEVVVGDTVRLGYFCQENPSMDPNLRVIDYVKEIGNRIETPEGMLTATQLLDKFLFSGDMQYSLISKLSGGEKRRLFLLSILAAAPNVLLLDEPTNDLDIQTLAVLEDYLEGFPGAVITVSHDRYFLDKVVRRTFALQEGGTVRAYPGGYSQYLEVREAEEKAAQISKATDAAKQPERPASLHKKLKFSYKEQREYESIEGEIAGIEKRIADMREKQTESASDYMALQSLQEQENALERELEERMERWLYLNDLAAQIEEQS